MSMFTYFFWLVAFVTGVVIAFFVPETTVPISGKFVFIGAWGAVLGLVLYNVCKRKLDIAEEDFNEALYSIKDSKLTMSSGISVNEPDPMASAPEPEDMPLPSGAISSKEALAKKVDEICVKFPLEAWKKYARCLLKDRPVPEVIKALQDLLPQLFPNASGILYMYAGTQTDLHKVLSFGETVISDDVIRPVEAVARTCTSTRTEFRSAPRLKALKNISVFSLCRPMPCLTTKLWMTGMPR